MGENMKRRDNRGRKKRIDEHNTLLNYTTEQSPLLQK